MHATYVNQRTTSSSHVIDRLELPARLITHNRQRRQAALLRLVGTELLPRLLRDGALDTAPLSEALPPFSSTQDALVG